MQQLIFDFETDTETSYVLYINRKNENDDSWFGWQKISKTELKIAYGDTPEDWKHKCNLYISMKAPYKYKIIKRSDVEIWRTN